jgi:hypothetical protein
MWPKRRAKTKKKQPSQDVFQEEVLDAEQEITLNYDEPEVILLPESTDFGDGALWEQAESLHDALSPIAAIEGIKVGDLIGWKVCLASVTATAFP